MLKELLDYSHFRQFGYYLIHRMSRVVNRTSDGHVDDDDDDGGRENIKFNPKNERLSEKIS